MSGLELGIGTCKIRLRLADILLVPQIKCPQSNIKRYRTICASIKAVGLIKPLAVHPIEGAPGKYWLLDGYLRLCALKELGMAEADCLTADSKPKETP